MSMTDEHLPPHPPCPAWPLAVNTQRTSSVSREIFISGRVGSVYVGLLVSFLQVGPGQEVRGLGSHEGQSVGPQEKPGRRGHTLSFPIGA